MYFKREYLFQLAINHYLTAKLLQVSGVSWWCHYLSDKLIHSISHVPNWFHLQFKVHTSDFHPLIAWFTHTKFNDSAALDVRGTGACLSTPRRQHHSKQFAKFNDQQCDQY